MCGRGALEEKIRQEALEHFGHHALPIQDVHGDWQDLASVTRAANVDMQGPRARYNIAPTDLIPTLDAGDGERYLHDSTWGWKTPKGPVFKARADRLHESPLWRSAYLKAHSVQVLSGFYEWRRGDRRAPVYISRHDGQPLYMAALTQRGRRTATITQAAPKWFHDVHDRIPVLLDAKDADAWCEPDILQDDVWNAAIDLDASDYEIRPISTQVNNTTNDGPTLIQPTKTWF